MRNARTSTHQLTSLTQQHGAKQTSVEISDGVQRGLVESRYARVVILSQWGHKETVGDCLSRQHNSPFKLTV
jgi:hypothetical protein